ncbi:MAG: YdcF family protein [Patescibacteria group bacterium]
MKIRTAFVITFITVIIIYAAVWIPWLVLRETSDITSSLEDLEKHDVAVIFGGLHESGKDLTETNRERLLAGAALIKEEKVTSLIVSNTSEATKAMKTFLLEQGISENQIELDTTAVVTADSCVAERNAHPEGRSVIFVSHGYHLPRILYSCHRLSVSGVGVPAEEIATIQRQELSQFDTLRIRFGRNQREALLTLLNILGIYGPTLEKEF